MTKRLPFRQTRTYWKSKSLPCSTISSQACLLPGWSLLNSLETSVSSTAGNKLLQSSFNCRSIPIYADTNRIFFSFFFLDTVGTIVLFKNDDDFFMDEDVDYQPVKMERDQSAASAQGKAIQQHQQQLQHQRQLVQLQELQQQLRQQQGNAKSGDPGSLFNHPSQPHPTGSTTATSVLFPVTQSNTTAPTTYTQPSPTLITTSLSLGAESSSSKPPTPATSKESEYERSVTGPGSDGSLSRKTSQDVDNFGQVLQMTSAVGGPPSILPSLQHHQQQQNLLSGIYLVFFDVSMFFVGGWHGQKQQDEKKKLIRLFFSCMSKKRPGRRFWRGSCNQESRAEPGGSTRVSSTKTAIYQMAGE